MRLITSRKALLALRPTHIQGEPMRLGIGAQVLLPLAPGRGLAFDEQESDKPIPAGFGPIEVTWAPRNKKLGTYDDAWLANGFPGFARDLDRSYFNAAPADQQLQRGEFWRGDEEIELENLHAAQPKLSARL